MGDFMGKSYIVHAIFFHWILLQCVTITGYRYVSNNRIPMSSNLYTLDMVDIDSGGGEIVKRDVDTTFRGHPKTREERWHDSFKSDQISTYSSEADSLVQLLNKIVGQYLTKCVPIILYDKYVEETEIFLLEVLFKKFAFTYLHGKISVNYTVVNPALLNPIDSGCRSYILFLSDILRAKEVLGPQTVNRVIMIPRSSQWKQQEFLATKASSDIINLLVISKSLSVGAEKANTYVLYTHRLYTDGLASNKPIVLTSWMNGKLSRPHIDLFPMKFLNGFAGHRFVVSAIHQPPYVVKKLSTDAVGNINIKWDGLELRILNLLGKRLNFTYEIYEPKIDNDLGPTFGVLEDISKHRADIGVSGSYVTIERLKLADMSVQHSKDCAAFITLVSKALPRYRAIMGPFQWPVWLAIIAIYLLAIFPLAFSDRLTLRHLIGNWGEMENMFWYVFGTFTNSLTFGGQFSWSNTKRNSTRILIGWYWVFTIIITSCYTGSIIAFVTLPVVPDTVDTLDDLIWGFYRIGTLQHDGWQYWFTNSSHASTNKVLKDLEFVADVEEGLSNVTKAFFWPYAFLGSRTQLEYIVEANFSDDSIGKRTALHISDECMSIFGISLTFPKNSVYSDRINNAILRLQQSGLIKKLNDDMLWESQKGSKHALLQTKTSKQLQAEGEERGLTLADTEGMFLLMGIGYLVAGGVLISEIIGGCANKCRKFVRKASIATSNQISRRMSSAQPIPRQTSSKVSITLNDESVNSSSSDSFEITQHMLRRKSTQGYSSSLNPFKNLYNRHRKQSFASYHEDLRHVQADCGDGHTSRMNGLNEDERAQNVDFSIENIQENSTDNSSANIELECESFEFTEVQINRVCTPFEAEETFGERV